MDYENVALAVITYYPKWYPGKLKSIRHTDKIRGDLALESINLALGKGLRVVDVDGQSSISFQKELSPLKNIQFIARRGTKRSPAKRQAFLAASKLPGVEVIIATEAEKLSLLTDGLEKLIDPIKKRGVKIVIPKRNDKLFKETYPSYQYQSETEGNTLYNEVLKTNGILAKETPNFDFLFGPRVFKNDPQILRLFLRKYFLKIGDLKLDKEYFDPEQHSNALFFPVVLALMKKYSVESVEIPFRYPKLQKDNEEFGARSFFQEKRRNQKLALLVELMYFVHFLKK